MHVLQFVKVAIGESYIAQFMFSPWSTQNTTPYTAAQYMHADHLDSDSVGHYISHGYVTITNIWKYILEYMETI